MEFFSRAFSIRSRSSSACSLSSFPRCFFTFFRLLLLHADRVSPIPSQHRDSLFPAGQLPPHVSFLLHNTTVLPPASIPLDISSFLFYRPYKHLLCLISHRRASFRVFFLGAVHGELGDLKHAEQERRTVNRQRSTVSGLRSAAQTSEFWPVLAGRPGENSQISQPACFSRLCL